MLQWKYQKTEYFKTATKLSTPSSESTAARAKKRFNISQLLYHPKFEPARSSVWQLQRDCWEKRGSTFAGVKEKASEIFAAIVLSSRVMPVAASTQWWPTRKPQKTIPEVLSRARNKALQHWRRWWCICQSESFCVKIKSVVLSVFPISKAKREYWKRRLVRKQTTGCQQVRRDDENYICWSEALSDINQTFRSGVCHNHALWREYVPDRHIMFISGHSSEQSVAHYSSRPSVS